jgi:hypothetical protein
MPAQTDTINRKHVSGKNAREGGVSAREGVLSRVREALSTDVSLAVLSRGLFLRATGHIHPSHLYPWVYWVTSSDGQAAYRVDLLSLECGCVYARARLGVCKHVVAAGAHFIERQEEVSA